MSYDAVAENSKTLGKKYTEEGNFGRAFSHYLVALKLKPEWGPQLKEEFSTVLCKWGTLLDQRKRFSDLFTCYEQAVEVFPEDAVILNNLGAHLLRCGLLKEAAHYFRKCLRVEPGFIRAGHNLEMVSNSAVERWHFRMLNDQHRNEAFREAILKRIKQGFDRVLDVGTGTGMLSLFAAEGKAKEIYACDSSPVMTEIAEQVFRSNNALEVKLIRKHSSEIQVPEDMGEKVSLLVTETFDAGLLGEDILETLSHAWQDLLVPRAPDKSSVVVPLGASIYVTGIELEAFANDLHLKLGGDLLEGCLVLRNPENYDTHDLSRARFRCLTETEKILEINFNDPEAMAEIQKRRVQTNLKCTSSGRLDCFAVWFDLCLDEDITLKTNPLLQSNSAWDQAVFPLPRSTTIRKNQDVPITATYKNRKLNVSFESFIDGPKFEVSEDVIRTLNDEKLSKGLRHVADTLSGTFEETIRVLDCYPFPVFGVNVLKIRKDRFEDELTCFVPTENDRRLVRHVAKKHELDVDVTVKTETCLEDCEKRFDVILLDLVERSGEMKDGVLLQLNYLKSLLKPGGFISPQQAVVMGQFIYSDWLSNASKVINDSVTCGYKIAEYINQYQVRHFIDLDLNSIESTVCSEPFELFSPLDSVESSIFEKTVPRSPAAVHANAMVYWFKIKFTETSEEMLTNHESSYHQSAILFPKTELPEMIKFNVIRSNGLFSIELLSL